MNGFKKKEPKKETRVEGRTSHVESGDTHKHRAWGGKQETRRIAIAIADKKNTSTGQTHCTPCAHVDIIHDDRAAR